MSAHIVGSSGSATLDQAALEMAGNASGRPLPPEMGSSVSLIVPVKLQKMPIKDLRLIEFEAGK
jgi:TonB family protein